MGKVANLVIFLGILGIILSILALTISYGLAHRGYGYRAIAVGLTMIGLGYGIRYRCKYCLYAAGVLFVLLSCNFLFKLIAHHTAYLSLRLVLCTWVSFRLIQCISPMQILIETDMFPDKNNHFKRFLIRQKHS